LAKVEKEGEGGRTTIWGQSRWAKKWQILGTKPVAICSGQRKKILKREKFCVNRKERRILKASAKKNEVWWEC